MAKFIDEVDLLVQAGKGGNGIISFRREANVDRGGPDGGDGGDGGSIYFLGDTGQNTLLNLYLEKHLKAEDGENGKPKNAYGAKGQDLVVKVPLGTMVYSNGNLIADVVNEEKYLIAKGGIGGKGNLHFKSSRNTAPRICENGTLGEKFDLHLTLKVLADVGFVGKPSAGKSTILSLISNAKPKIADYEFTTLVPQLGLVKYYENSFVAADLPGIIKNASEGKGLGIQFLKHIERCKVIAHIIDFGSLDKNPIEDYKIINNELKSYNLRLEKLPQVVIANKSDLEGFEKNLKTFKAKFPKVKIVENSAFINPNIIEIKGEIWKILQKVKDINTEKAKDEVVVIKFSQDPIKINKLNANTWEISGENVYKIYDKIPLVSRDNLWRLNAKLRDLGVFELIKQTGVKNGDTIKIRDFEFTWDEENF
ncbi:GTP-binding protein [Metamycoplasma subdolum]|uniref:GTPase Obg n=1 Tax=Metamycoplasma subdolum TaxID=92407 RepID=A0A3L9ZYM6_9BACT|nr:GTPase ObgE [Metamycoplasma subdolum]RMA77550.1 GTP-binding protein [Metamycoplasma subdolum]WPB50344.1 GTPase ObgE [Metamycoplasma subdolum]